ncbi:MAG TPA: hypothetical protein VFZ21_08550 [Gemmatimonadaceae bacterium]|jgi:hypothetical protein|nr:hypothetical protein [Gemmatimonadaceae bacterium]
MYARRLLLAALFIPACTLSCQQPALVSTDDASLAAERGNLYGARAGSVWIV